MEKSIEYTYLKLPLYFLSTKHFLLGILAHAHAIPSRPPFLDGGPRFGGGCNKSLIKHRLCIAYRIS